MTDTSKQVAPTSKELTLGGETFNIDKIINSMVELSVATGHTYHRRIANACDLIRALIKERNAPETPVVAPETLVVWVAADYWRCRCKAPGDINNGNSYQCRDCGTIRPEKATAAKAG